MEYKEETNDRYNISLIIFTFTVEHHKTNCIFHNKKKEFPFLIVIYNHDHSFSLNAFKKRLNPLCRKFMLDGQNKR